jgi:Putative Actinobacterial Holin-X, holin superfamily III
MDNNISKDTNTPFMGDSDERESWKIMMSRFYHDVTDLFEKEGRLIRTEMNEKVSQFKTASVSLASSGIVLFIGAQCLAATAIILLDYVMPLWLSVVIVTAIFLVTGGVMLASAKKKLNTRDLKPNKSIEAFDHIRFSLKEKVNEITKH